MITNLAMANTTDDLELYFVQAAKDDNFKFELLKHCRGCVTSTSGSNKLETYEKIYKMISYLYGELTRREKLVKTGLGRRSEDLNIHVYNKKFKDKMPVLQLWIDEGASLYKKSGNKEIDKIIAECTYMVERLAAAGRFVGMYVINIMQRASKDEVPREIKINTLNWVSAAQVDKGASKVAIGDEDACIGLPDRVFAYTIGGDKINYFKTPTSHWNKNLEFLEKQNKVRSDESDTTLKMAYSHWLEYEEEVDDPNSPNNYNSNNNKLINQAINDLNKKVIEYEEDISNLKLELNSNAKTITKLTEQNKSLMRIVKLDNNPTKDPTDYSDEELTDSKNILKEIKKLEYKTYNKQKNDISNMTIEENQYKEIDLEDFSKFSNNSNKKVIKK